MAQPTPKLTIAKTSKTARVFACCFCMDEECHGTPIILNKSFPESAEGNTVCPDCAQQIAGFFLDAERHEHHYPPPEGSIRPQLEQLLPFLRKGLAHRYAQRVQEYETPVKQRLYCKQMLLNAEGHME